MTTQMPFINVCLISSYKPPVFPSRLLQSIYPAVKWGPGEAAHINGYLVIIWGSKC